jgi:WD40 repeat protein
MSHIFISYSRRDLNFAQKIVDALAENELDTWIDWKSIPKGEDWEQEIYRGIEEADAFLFLISPDSVESEMCNKEIAHAVANGKRILPIVVRDTDEKHIHVEISKRNWIFCREKGDNFDKAIEEAGETIHTDYEWLKYHTRLQVRALEWERTKDTSQLLRGRELHEADELIGAAGSERDPQPTDVQRQYILASKRNEERQRRQITIGLGLGLILMAVLAVFAWGQRNSAVASESTAIAEANAKATALVGEQVALEDAQNQRAAAVENLSIAQTQEAIAKQNAEEARRQAMFALSDKLSTLALAQVDSDYTEALLLGVESVRILEENQLDPGNKSDILPTLLQKTQAGLLGTLSRPPYGIVRKVVFDRGGRLLASASESVDLWDTTKPDSPNLLMSWTGKDASDVVFSHDSTLLIAGYRDGSVGFFDVKNLKEIGSFQVYQANKTINVRVALKSDGKTMAVVGNGKLTIWDLAELASPVKLFESFVPHKGLEITDLFFHPSIQNYLISSGDDRFVRVWDLQYPGSPVLQNTIQRDFGTTAIAIGPNSDANFILIGGSYFDFYNGAFRPIQQFYYGDYLRESIHSATINASGYRLYAASGDGMITEWSIGDVRDIRLFRTFSGHTNRVNSMAIHPNGQIIVSGGNDSKIFYWDLMDEPQLPVWTKKILSKVGINDIAYSEEHNYLAVGEADNTISLWNVSDPAAWVRKSSFKQPTVQLTFSPTQDRLAVLAFRHGNLDSSVSTLDVTNLTYSDKKWLFDLNSVGYFAFGENYVLAAEDKGDGLVSIYSWDISNPFMSPKGQNRIDVTRCPSIDSAYASKVDLAAVISCDIQMWDFSGNKVPVLSQSDELGAINSPKSAAFHPNGEILAIGTGDESNSIQLWRILVKDGKVDAAFISDIKNPHLRPVTSVAFSVDGNMLASGSEDQTVAVWDISDIQNPKYRFSLKGHSGPILYGGVFFSYNGKTLISATKAEVILWNIDQDFWFEKACQIAGRNFNDQEWAEFVGDEPYHATCPGLQGQE